MANDKTYDRHVNIWINGKEVVNNISSIKSETIKATNELAKMTRGSQEYNDKVLEVRKLKGILKEHQDGLRESTGLWDKIKGSASSGIGIVTKGIGILMLGYQSIKGVLTSTGDLSDRVEFVLGGWKNGLDELMRSIGKFDLKNLSRNIRMAVEEGQRYAKNLDEIDEKTIALQIAEAKGENALIAQQKIQRDVRESLIKRNEAGEKAIQIEEDLAGIRIGIADQAYKNELENVTKIANPGKTINDQMREEIELYVSRDKVFMKSLAPAEQYRKILAQIQDLRKQETYQADELGRSVKIVSKDQEILQLQKQITDEMLRSNEVLTRVTIPTDEKYRLLGSKIVALEVAKGSANKDTMKIFTTNAKIENQIDKEQEEKIKKQTTDFKLLKNVIEDVGSQLTRYYSVVSQEDLDTDIKKIRDRQITDLDNEMAINEDNIFKQIELQRKKNEILRRNEVDNARAIGADVQLVNEKYAKLDLKLDEQKIKAKLDLAAGFFGNMATIFGKQTAVGKAAAIAETTINTYASATAAFKALAGIPIVGPVLGAIAAAAAVAAGLANVRQILKVNTDTKGFRTGGFTGTGNKNEPVGIVHAGEWVANADMVASPRTGPIIQALEQDRVNRISGYATGGVPGMNSSGFEAATAGSSSDLIKVLSSLKATNDKLNLAINELRRNGVSMKFGWNEADNVKKGLNKLNDIEDSMTT